MSTHPQRRAQAPLRLTPPAGLPINYHMGYASGRLDSLLVSGTGCLTQIHEASPSVGYVAESDSSMMRRAILIHSLVLLILACPYLCLAELVAAVSERAESSCCGQCRCGDESSRSAPGNEDSNRDAGNCFCHGAIMDGSRNVAVPADGAPLGVPLLAVNPGVLCGALPAAPRDPAACHFPPCSSGRDICALVCALLL